MRIRKIRVIGLNTPNDWWLQQGLIGREMDTTSPDSLKDSAQVLDTYGAKALIPLALCLINPHIRLIKGGRR